MDLINSEGLKAIILGSGFGAFLDHFEVVRALAYGDVAGFEYEELEGHERCFYWCRYLEEEFLVLSGKLHYYEGLSFGQIVEPIRLAIEDFGVKEILVTSASGGLSQTAKVGKWMELMQVISIPVVNFGETIFAAESRGKSRKEVFESIKNGVYAYHQGPSTGSVSEYRMLSQLGADLVGMSMYPEYCYLRSRDVDAHFLSLPVCNYFPFTNVEEASFEEVLEVSASGVTALVELFKYYLTAE